MICARRYPERQFAFNQLNGVRAVGCWLEAESFLLMREIMSTRSQPKGKGCDPLVDISLMVSSLEGRDTCQGRTPLWPTINSCWPKVFLPDRYLGTSVLLRREQCCAQVKRTSHINPIIDVASSSDLNAEIAFKSHQRETALKREQLRLETVLSY